MKKHVLNSKYSDHWEFAYKKVTNAGRGTKMQKQEIADKNNHDSDIYAIAILYFITLSI